MGDMQVGVANIDDKVYLLSLVFYRSSKLLTRLFIFSYGFLIFRAFMA